MIRSETSVDIVLGNDKKPQSAVSAMLANPLWSFLSSRVCWLFCVLNLHFDEKGAVFANLSYRLSLPWHGESSGEPCSVMI